MRSVDDVRLGRRLHAGLQSISAAGNEDDTLLASARAAHELASVDGMYVIFHDGAAFIALGTGDGPTQPATSAALKQFIASTIDSATARDHPLPGYELPDGRRVNADMAFAASVAGVRARYETLGFFWCQRPSADDSRLIYLPALASAFDLVMQRHAQLRFERERHRALLIELQHRSRNHLALLRSIIRRSGASAESVEELTSHLEGRVSALARIQGGLALDSDAGLDLEDLVRTELTATAVRDTQFTIDGPPIRLSQQVSETMTLALHELTTNALKFGALSVPSGHISIGWSVAQETAPVLRTQWLESGIDIALITPRLGFGRELIERQLPYELGARTEFAVKPGGLRCDICLPLDEREGWFVTGRGWRTP